MGSRDGEQENASRTTVTRFGVSMDAHLLARFDELIGRQGYTNRSEAFRDLIRDRLVEARWESRTGDVPAVVVLVYDHRVRLIGDQITSMQHDHMALIVSSMHVHLDETSCLEVTVMHGPAQDVRELAQRMLSLRGVRHGRLIVTGTGE